MSISPIINGWFSEINEFWEGQALSLKIDGDILFKGKSKFQEVLVFKSVAYGNVLVLDNAIQITEKDECSYQEMITHIPMFSHMNPKRVLVIGGGDGGVVREVTKHDSVEEIVLCEIDEMVIEVSKKYLPTISIGYNDPRVKIVVGEGKKFLEENKGKFDVIITDSCDTSSTAASPLFGPEFFKAAYHSLTDDGIIISQAESIWLDKNEIGETYEWIKQSFDAVKYLTTSVPTYPTGTIGFFLSSKNGKLSTKPLRKIPESMVDKLVYYTEDMHEKAFVHPAFLKRKYKFLNE